MPESTERRKGSKAGLYPLSDSPPSKGERKEVPSPSMGEGQDGGESSHAKSSRYPVWHLRQAADYLAGCGVSTPRLDAEVFLAEALRTDRTGLYRCYSSSLAQEEIGEFWRLIGRRGKREPLPYITGRQEFWSLEFLVDPRVLIPRSETEVVVETVLRIVQNTGQEGEDTAIRQHGEWAMRQLSPRPRVSASPCLPRLRMLDIGTGSGCIAVALAKELPGAEIWAVDISAAALTVAEANAARHKVADQITFLQGDLFTPVADQEGLFDLIVSNPPYVAEEELSALQEEVRRWEPHLALNGGKAGVAFHQRLIAESPCYLRQGGWLVMEIGQGQERAIASRAEERGGFEQVHFVKDYAGIDRVAAVQTKPVLSQVEGTVSKR